MRLMSSPIGSNHNGGRTEALSMCEGSLIHPSVESHMRLNAMIKVELVGILAVSDLEISMSNACMFRYRQKRH